MNSDVESKQTTYVTLRPTERSSYPHFQYQSVYISFNHHSRQMYTIGYKLRKFSFFTRDACKSHTGCTTFLTEFMLNNAIPCGRILQQACVRYFVVPDPGASGDRNLPSCTVETEIGGKQHSTCGSRKASFV